MTVCVFVCVATVNKRLHSHNCVWCNISTYYFNALSHSNLSGTHSKVWVETKYTYIVRDCILLVFTSRTTTTKYTRNHYIPNPSLSIVLPPPPSLPPHHYFIDVCFRSSSGQCNIRINTTTGKIVSSKALIHKGENRVFPWFQGQKMYSTQIREGPYVHPIRIKAT